MIAFIDAHREADGAKPTCRVLSIAPWTYFAAKARERDPRRQPARNRRDAALSDAIRRVWEANFPVYGVRKVRKQLHRDGVPAARCTVERWMRRLGLRGATRGTGVVTKIPIKDGVCPLDRVQRRFAATQPNRLWVADFTYVVTWRGFVYWALVIDVFSRRIVGWRAALDPAHRSGTGCPATSAVRPLAAGT